MVIITEYYKYKCVSSTPPKFSQTSFGFRPFISDHCLGGASSPILQGHSLCLLQFCSFLFPQRKYWEINSMSSWHTLLVLYWKDVFGKYKTQNPELIQYFIFFRQGFSCVLSIAFMKIFCISLCLILSGSSRKITRETLCISK